LLVAIQCYQQNLQYSFLVLSVKRFIINRLILDITLAESFTGKVVLLWKILMILNGDSPRQGPLEFVLYFTNEVLELLPNAAVNVCQKATTQAPTLITCFL
jgi:hypothetical protein